MMLSRYAVILFIGGLLALAAAIPAEAKNKKSTDGGRPSIIDSEEIAFTASQRTIILDYFASEGSAASSRSKPLPPGIAKKVARGGALPPGIAKRYLPQDLDVRLPPPPIGVERVIVGGDVLLVQISTGAILDMLRGALR
jgi:hypothetical protein